MFNCSFEKEFKILIKAEFIQHLLPYTKGTEDDIIPWKFFGTKLPLFVTNYKFFPVIMLR